MISGEKFTKRFLPVLLCTMVMLLAVPASAAQARSDVRSIAASLSPTLSVSSNLTNRRYVAAGDRAYDLGSEDGRYPAMGFHTRGEMGGIWAPPIKLLDGIWFGINGQWIGPATSFTSGFGYAQMALPTTNGVQITRTDFAPDGRHAVEFGLTLTASNSAPFELNVDAHSELMGAYPWGFTTPNQLQFNLPDTAAFNGQQLVFREVGTPPVANATSHDWAAVVGATGLTPASGTTGSAFRGPQDPPVICPASGPDLFRCDDTAYGKGAGGELTYTLKPHANTSLTVWFTVAGSDQGLSAAQAEYQAASANPASELQAKVASRLALDSQTQVSLPADPALAAAVTWSKQNMADLTQQADNVNIRPTEQGTVYPAPVGSLPSIRFEGAGFPDYPWMFATDQEYTMYALLAAGQFTTAENGLRSLAAVSDIANNKSGKVVHETVSDGSVYYGLNDEVGDIDETAKFPTAVAMVWRWTGDSSFRDELYGFSVRNVQYLVNLAKSDDDLWPDGSGNVESSVLGAEPVDVAVYTIRALLDVADMAASKHDTTTEHWALNHAAAMERAFQGAWWLPNIPQYADSLTDPNNQPLMQRWWIGVTPMEAELYSGGVEQPGLAPSA
ncbi:MAG TPA: glycogen debranching protein, partial [Chloroflexota bacterium]